MVSGSKLCVRKIRMPVTPVFYAHPSPQARREWAKYYTGGHKALPDVLPASQVHGPSSNREAGGWAEGGNVLQALVARILTFK